MAHKLDTCHKNWTHLYLGGKYCKGKYSILVFVCFFDVFQGKSMDLGEALFGSQVIPDGIRIRRQ